jgi:ferredoxin
MPTSIHAHGATQGPRFVGPAPQTEEQNMPALVNRDLCNACEDCIDMCPVEAITLTDGKALVDADECTDCYACVDPCSEDAISVDDE